MENKATRSFDIYMTLYFVVEQGATLSRGSMEEIMNEFIQPEELFKRNESLKVITDETVEQELRSTKWDENSKIGIIYLKDSHSYTLTKGQMAQLKKDLVTDHRSCWEVIGSILEADGTIN